PNGKWFYFNKDTYQMVTGKLTDDHKDYWLDEDAGLLYDAWVQDAKGNWLHTDDNGVLATGWFKTKSGYWFYFNQDHTMKTGILTDRGYTFWLDKNDGLLYNEWVKDSQGKWLRTDGNGCLLTGWYHAPNGKWFYFNDDYTMKVGELKENGKIYTFDVNQGWVATRTEEEPSKPEANPNQTPSDTQSGWIKNADGSYSYKDNNKFVKGWFKTPNGKWWYFNKATNKAEFGMVKAFSHNDIEGYPSIYWIDYNQGLVYNSWVKDNKGNSLYIGNYGTPVTGDVVIDGKKCHFDRDFIYQPNYVDPHFDAHEGGPLPDDIWFLRDYLHQDDAALKQGAFAFFKAQGATRALDVLNNSKLASFTKKGGHFDGTRAGRMVDALHDFKQINDFRVKSGLPEFKVSYRLMADAMVVANYFGSFKYSDYLKQIKTPTSTGLHSWYNGSYEALGVYWEHDTAKVFPDVSDSKVVYAGYASRGPYLNIALNTSLQDGEQAMTLDEYWDKFTTWIDSVK
ncbi:hypothetical protein AC070_04540, partial [Fannyhessea vaginae]|uniref:cell wall-binding protein n=1 Tax=Fannyhessea vaginae TaxID=82135 RepID=UPI00067203B6